MFVVSFVEWRVAAKARKAQEKGLTGYPENQSPIEVTVYSK